MSLSLVDLEVIAKSGQPEDRLSHKPFVPFYGLKVGARTAGIVRVLLIIFFPVAYPISKLLDWVLGKGHFALLRRAELKTLVDMHGNEAGKGGELTHDETTIITGALDLTQKAARDAMTPIHDTFLLDINAKLDMHTMSLIMTKGHSRVPIYSGNPTNIIGLILVKNLITCRPEDEIPIKSVTIRKIPRVYEDLPLYDILNEFQKGHSHMAVVVKRMNPETGNDRNKGNAYENRKDHRRKYRPGDGSQSSMTENMTSILIDSPVNKNVIESQSPAVKTNLDRQGDARSQSRRSDRGRHDNILDINLESLPSYPLDEEVVGIITMEDLMEELIQEEILDETDEYVDVHNKIRINMLPPKTFSPSSQGIATLSQYLVRSPVVPSRPVLSSKDEDASFSRSSPYLSN
ncbi:hypothetical protein HPP92_014094 [Vanilla planifolia]|uniref:CNNM transmembrane domain-containing protein n=1 Tax=Vanilla planifolia TaxID=51239 RepID=A0A835QTR7_VANPL|nr:hypothetical protein HPP92_014094 [Vanilla planifolia]